MNRGFKDYNSYYLYAAKFRNEIDIRSQSHLSISKEEFNHFLKLNRYPIFYI